MHIALRRAEVLMSRELLNRPRRRASDGRELFGNFTPASSTMEGPRASDGFAALRFFDRAENGGNENLLIDAGDVIFAPLLLWVDRNHDGVSQSPELQTLSDAGVISIGLDPKEARRQDEFGNWFRYRSPALVESRGKIEKVFAYDVYLASR